MFFPSLSYSSPDRCSRKQVVFDSGVKSASSAGTVSFVPSVEICTACLYSSPSFGNFCGVDESSQHVFEARSRLTVAFTLFTRRSSQTQPNLDSVSACPCQVLIDENLTVPFDGQDFEQGNQNHGYSSLVQH